MLRAQQCLDAVIKIALIIMDLDCHNDVDSKKIQQFPTEKNKNEYSNSQIITSKKRFHMRVFVVDATLK